MAGIGHRGFMGRKKGGSPVNPCGTGALYPPGWRFLHDEISGGLGSWGNMLKVSGFNSFGAFLEDVSSNSTNLCYKDGSIDLGTADAFFSGDADVETLFDQFELNNLIDDVPGDGYDKSDNLINKGGCITSGLTGALASLRIGDPWTVCMVLDFKNTPTAAQQYGTFIGSPFLRVQFTVADTFMVRFEAPNQGYFYNGLRNSGVKMITIVYDGTLPINRSGLSLYWNGVLQVPSGIYNSGVPANNTISNFKFSGNQTNPDYACESDLFNFAFSQTEVDLAMEILEQKYTFS